MLVRPDPRKEHKLRGRDSLANGPGRHSPVARAPDGDRAVVAFAFYVNITEEHILRTITSVRAQPSPHIGD